MKRRVVCIITFIIIIFSFSTYFYLNNGYKRIDIFTAKNFRKETITPISSITDKTTLKEILTIIKTPNKIDGKLDVDSYNYVLQLHSFTNDIKPIYLWLSEDSIRGMILKNETYYSISEENTLKLKQIMMPSEN